MEKGEYSENYKNKGKEKQKLGYDLLKSNAKSKEQCELEIKNRHDKGISRKNRHDTLYEEYKSKKQKIDSFLGKYGNIDIVKPYQNMYRKIKEDYPNLFENEGDNEPRLIADITKDGKARKSHNVRQASEIQTRQAIDAMKNLAMVMGALEDAVSEIKDRDNKLTDYYENKIRGLSIEYNKFKLPIEKDSLEHIYKTEADPLLKKLGQRVKNTTSLLEDSRLDY